MQIWLINPFDELPGEGPEQRYAALARVFLEQGHEVLWVSCAFRHRTKQHADAGLQSRELPKGMSETPPSAARLSVCLVAAPGYGGNLTPQRLWSHRCWGKRIVRELGQKVAAGALTPPDRIIASTPPLEGAEAAIRLGKKFGAKVTVDFMDDWPRTWLQALPARRVIQSLGRIALSPWQRAATRIMQTADTVSAQSEFFARRAVELGHPGDVHVCYLGERPLPGLSKPQPAPEMFTVLYLGAMGRIYDLESVLRAAKWAKEQGKPWKWVLAGSDPGQSWQTRAEQLGLSSDVTFPGYVSERALWDVLTQADVGLVPMDPRSGVAVPYKACHYLAAGLPVVNTLPGELSALLTAYGAGATVPHRSPETLYKAVAAYADNPEGHAKAREAALALFAAEFDRNHIYPRWADWILT
ncbi:MAG: glycosyltransferase family 4 protein [Verrucomicrobia bacterium]|nr:glycosyltransferase family 4 protein [Verrucomicrobiota bacterium]MCH8510329.1 glycosyltransferase family 4 protein [Kiritimatiellia bacterium]